MSVRDLAREALRALESNRGRSALTILGIVIGIAAVIAMTSLIGGIQNSLIGGLGLNAARTVYISASTPLTQKDVERLARTMPEYEFIEGTMYGHAEKKTDAGTVNVSIQGMSARLMEGTGTVRLASGRTFTAQEEASGGRVLILDRDGVRLLFGDPDMDVIGRSVTLGNRDYAVVGIAESQGVPSDQLYMNVYMPLQTVENDFSAGWAYLSSVVGMAREGVDVDELGEATKLQLATLMGIDADEVDDSVWIYTMKSQIDMMNSFMGSFQLIMGAVAGISLLVGGIGIMNMMLTNVTERIREIGVRRALGARRRDITLQFLAESASLCIAGGIVGTVLGYLIAWGLAAFASLTGLASSMGANGTVTPSISVATVALAAGISIGIGVIFGYYPARRAAKLDPVECLRYQ